MWVWPSFDHERPVVGGELGVVAAGDVGGLVVGETHLGGPSLVMGRDGDAESPDSQFDGLAR